MGNEVGMAMNWESWEGIARKDGSQQQTTREPWAPWHVGEEGVEGSWEPCETFPPLRGNYSELFLLISFWL